ncbi:MAG: GNAT family N-acetyltransferase [Prevotella sp.]|nr:GNAT family N-acetyltransferase [Prevotella sp.]
MKSVPVLHTDRCTLSAVTKNDVSVLRQILNDAETQRFLPELCEEFHTSERLKQFVASFDKYRLRDEGILWGIHKDSIFIGIIAIMDISVNPTLFYAMHPHYRHKGYFKESLRIALDFLWKSGICMSIRTEVNIDNEISQAILKNTGFHQLSYYNDERSVFYRFF